MSLTWKEKAVRAQGLLRDEVLKEAFANVRTEAFEEFEESAPEDIEARNSAYYRLKAVESVHNALEQFVEDAKVNEAQRKD